MLLVAVHNEEDKAVVQSCAGQAALLGELRKYDKSFCFKGWSLTGCVRMGLQCPSKQQLVLF